MACPVPPPLLYFILFLDWQIFKILFSFRLHKPKKNMTQEPSAVFKSSHFITLYIPFYKYGLKENIISRLTISVNWSMGRLVNRLLDKLAFGEVVIERCLQPCFRSKAHRGVNLCFLQQLWLSLSRQAMKDPHRLRKRPNNSRKGEGRQWPGHSHVKRV